MWMNEPLAVRWYKEKDVILPGHQSEVAQWLADNNQ